MIFQNRQQAGQKLAQALPPLADKKDLIVLALPRGGVAVAVEIAQSLKAPLDVIICRKIGAPGNPEFAIGAISEAGGLFLNEEIINVYNIKQNYIHAAIKQEQEKIRTYQEEFRNGRKLPSLKNKTVIITDDGAATGLTLKAALAAVRKLNPYKIIVALPVAPPTIANELKKIADEVIILETPPFFQAVGQFYADFRQVETAEVKEMLANFKPS